MRLDHCVIQDVDPKRAIIEFTVFENYQLKGYDTGWA